jgi:hypothetical protein
MIPLLCLSMLEEKNYARSDQPQLRACESDLRGDDRDR